MVLRIQFTKQREVATMLMDIFFIFLVVIIAFGATRLKAWKSGVRMMNAEWLEDNEKFRLITRWGVMG